VGSLDLLSLISSFLGPLTSVEFQIHSSKMKSFYICFAAALATVASAARVEICEERAITATPKVYLAGDSTMAQGGGGTGTQGSFPSST